MRPSAPLALGVCLTWSALSGPGGREASAGDALSYVLRGTASPEVTAAVDGQLRRQFVRYARIWPPRSKPAAPPTIELSGTLDQYQRALADHRLSVANPACFLVGANRVLLGFDGARYDEALRSARRKAELLRTRQRKLVADFNAQLKVDEARYRREGRSSAEINALAKTRRKGVDRETVALRHDLEKAEAELETRIAEATDRLLSAAAHEAWHAYVAAYVFPPSAGEVPRWLDEGLAQAVEHGIWTGDDLVVERPPPELLRRWDEARRDPAGEQRLALAELLEAGGSQFVLPGTASAGDVAGNHSARTYLSAWSLAQYLLASGRLKPSESLDRYVADYRTPPVERFVKWQGRPLDEVERDWKVWQRRFNARFPD